MDTPVLFPAIFRILLLAFHAVQSDQAALEVVVCRVEKAYGVRQTVLNLADLFLQCSSFVIKIVYLCDFILILHLLQFIKKLID